MLRHLLKWGTVRPQDRIDVIWKRGKCYICVGSLYVRKTWDSRDVKSHSKDYNSDDGQVLFSFYSMELRVALVIFNLHNHNLDKE